MPTTVSWEPKSARNLQAGFIGCLYAYELTRGENGWELKHAATERSELFNSEENAKKFAEFFVNSTPSELNDLGGWYEGLIE